MLGFTRDFVIEYNDRALCLSGSSRVVDIGDEETFDAFTKTVQRDVAAHFMGEVEGILRQSTGFGFGRGSTNRSVAGGVGGDEGDRSKGVTQNVFFIVEGLVQHVISRVEGPRAVDVGESVQAAGIHGEIGIAVDVPTSAGVAIVTVLVRRAHERGEIGDVFRVDIRTVGDQFEAVAVTVGNSVIGDVFILVRRRWEHFPFRFVGIHFEAQAKLFKAVLAARSTGRFAGTGKRREQYGGKDADDGDYHQEFD